MNILFLCIYPINNPRHGGQLRVRNIVDAYRAAGHKVQIIGVLSSDSYEREEGFLPFPSAKDLVKFVKNPFLMEDYAIGQLFATEKFLYQRLVSQVTVTPDVIHVEQPWLYRVAERFVYSKKPSPSLIYSSHNVEWKLKREILSGYFNKSHAEFCGELIRNLEVAAIRGADAVVCVSKSDVGWVKAQQSSEAEVILAENGVKAWCSTVADRSEAVAKVGNHRYALYCASAHPPNMTGFFEMFGGGFGSLKPDEKLVVAGGAGVSIEIDQRVHNSAQLYERLVPLGIVTQPCLEGLLDMAHCIVLPLTQGGGSNLKTAEALWSGKHIVATSVAMRGFESFVDQAGVHVADDPIAFKRALRMVMEMKPLQLSESEVVTRQKVLWQQCLNPLLEFVDKLGKETPK